MTEQNFVDGVSEPVAPTVTAATVAVTTETTTPIFRTAIMGIVSIPYIMYVFWCVYLLGTFPVMGGSRTMIMIGVATAALAGIIFLAIGSFGYARISTSKANANIKLKALIKVCAFILPGLLLSAITPFIIVGEPSLTISIISPLSSTQFIAPLSVAFSVQNAVDVLTERGFTPVQYNWDINADHKIDQQTLNPALTANFDREGIYVVSVTMKNASGVSKVASKRFTIYKSVFSVNPLPAIKDRPIFFSLTHLYPDQKNVVSVAWDFDGDGVDDEKNGNLQSTFTYIRTGTFTPKATVQLLNKTQVTYEREIEVVEPAPLPFPISVKTSPQFLIGSPDFTVKFTAKTDELLHSIQWKFGDGGEGQGNPVTHTFTQNGKFPVTALVRAESGAVAEIVTLVKIVDRLDLPDLTFKGSHPVDGNKISGEAPLTIDLTPSTQKSFVTFSWEVENASEVGSTDTHLQAIFRDPGKYTIILVAKDPDDKVLRQPITVEVLPPSPYADFTMSPASGVTTINSKVDFDASGASYIPDDDEIIVYSWDFGDGTADKLGVGAASHIYKNPDTYLVKLVLTSRKGLELSAEHRVVIRSLGLQSRIFIPEAISDTGNSGKVVVLRNKPIMFKGDSSEGSIVNYAWNFGDGSQNGGTDLRNTTHVFTNTGTYTVSLQVTNAAGKTDESSVSIIVQ